MNKERKKIKSVAVLIFLLVCCCFLLIFFTEKKEVVAQETLAVRLKTMTEDDVIDDSSGLTIEQFTRSYKGGEYKPTGYIGAYNVTTHLTKAIPLEFFHTVGAHVYMGKEYGMVVYTQVNEFGNEYSSQFMLIDFDIVRTFSSGTDVPIDTMFNYRVEMLLQSFVQTSQNASGLWNIVQPESWLGTDMYLKLNYVAFNLANENEYNYMDADYVMGESEEDMKDKGDLIRTADMYYRNYTKGEIDWAPLENWFIDFVIAKSTNFYLNNFVGEEMANIVKKGVSVYKDYNNFTTALEEVFDSQQNVVHSSVPDSETKLFNIASKRQIIREKIYDTYPREIYVKTRNDSNSAFFIPGESNGNLGEDGRDNKNSFVELEILTESVRANDRLTFASGFTIGIDQVGEDLIVVETENGYDVQLEGTPGLNPAIVSHVMEEKRFKDTNVKHIQEEGNLCTDNTYDQDPGYILDDNGYKLYKFTPQVKDIYTFTAQQNGNVAPYLDMFLLPSTVDLDEVINMGYWELRDECLAYSDTQANGINSLTHTFNDFNNYYLLYKPSESYDVGKRLFTARYQFTPQSLVLGNNTITFNNTLEAYFRLAMPSGYEYKISTSAPNVWFVQLNSDGSIVQSGSSLNVTKGAEDIYFKADLDTAQTGTINVKCERKMTVTYHVGNDTETEIVYLPSTTINLPTIDSNAGYEFNGWFLDEAFSEEFSGIQYFTDAWLQELDLYAHVALINYTITFNLYNPLYMQTEIATDTYTVEDEKVLADGYVTEHYFRGWFTNPSFSGAPVFCIPKGSTGNRTFYGDVTEYSSVVLDVNSAQAGNNTVTMTYNGSVVTQTTYYLSFRETYVLPVPSASGYLFDGWYCGTERVTDENGVGLSVCNFDSNTALVAKWEEIATYIFRVIDDETGNETWLVNGVDGFDYATSQQMYSSSLCPNCLIKYENGDTLFLEKPNKQFAFFYLADGPVVEMCWCNDDSLVPGETYTLKMHYLPRTYNVVFAYGEVVSQPVTIAYDQMIAYPDYSPAGYVVKWTYDGGKVFEYTKMPEVTDYLVNGTFTLTAVKRAITYNIYYDFDDSVERFLTTPTMSYTIETGYIELPIIVGDEYSYHSWYYNGEVITGISPSEYLCDMWLTINYLDRQQFMCTYTLVYGDESYMSSYPSQTGTVETGTSITLPPALSEWNYELYNWYAYTSEGYVSYMPGETVYITENITFYSYWANVAGGWSLNNEDEDVNATEETVAILSKDEETEE